jgi:signal transduction histidine kinase/ligand-binding sensor domain-containing protein
MIIQDHEGFLWFATDNGLHRYDGYEFTSYYNDQNDSTTITGSSIRCLLEDHNKSLWVGGIGGLSIYNRDLDNFNRIPLHLNGKDIYTFDTRTIIETEDKKIYIGISNRGIFKYNRSNHLLEKLIFDIPDFNSDNIDYINTLVIDKSGRFWVSTDDKGLFLLDIKQKKFIQFSPKSNHKLSSPLTFSTIQDSQGYLWVATDQGINKINPVTLETTIYKHEENNPNSLSFNMVWRAYEDPNNNLWICTDGGGLNLYNRDLDNFIHYKSDKGSEFSIAGNKLNSIFADKQNNLYINVLGHGFSITNLGDSETFISYVHSSDPETSVGFNIIHAFVEDKNNNLWIGTDGGGLDFFDRKNNKFTHYKSKPNDPNSLTTNTIVSLHIDKNDVLWVGTYKGGLSKFNPENKTFFTYKSQENNPNSLNNNDIRSIIEDKQGNLILATCGGGVNVFNPENKQFTHHIADPYQENTLCDNYCQTIFQDSEETIWIGTFYGLSRWDRTTNKFTTYLHDPKDTNSINGFIIFSIFEDKNKNLWFGTSSGLNSFDRKTETFSNIFIDDNSVFGIKDDKNGDLWLSTEKGILKYQVAERKIIRFESKTGLQGQNFKPGASYKTKSGEILFGGNHGFIAFYPENIKKSTYKYPVLITNFQILNTPVSIGTENSPLKKHISRTKKITLDYNENYISFKYVALNFYNTKQIHYAYKMEGFDDEWHFVGTERKATYSNISPGIYTFRVATTTDNKSISQNQTSLQIRILPPWWDTIWFKSGIVLIIIVVLGIIYYIRINNLEKQKALLDKKVIQRTREVAEKNRELIISNNTKDKLFSIIAHDLKNPFSNILGFTELLSERFYKMSDEKKLKYIKILNESSEKIYILLENLLQWSGSQTGRIKYNPAVINLKEIAEINLNIFKPQLVDKNITVNKSISENLYLFTDRNMIHTIIRNLISNAIKFTNENGEIAIKADPIGNFAEITIADNGIGIPKQQVDKIFNIDSEKSRPGTKGENGTGLGLIICKEFIKRNKGEMSVQSEEGKGTTFKFTVPLHK